uniref:Uncharacterized protein n=1 Tax=Rhizophora mucronata TaxID=61149 RepID=A0A2P2QF06_RHIMU
MIFPKLLVLIKPIYFLDAALSEATTFSSSSLLVVPMISAPAIYSLLALL